MIGYHLIRSIPVCSCVGNTYSETCLHCQIGYSCKSSLIINGLAQQPCTISSCWSNFSGLVYVQTTLNALGTSNTGTLCGIREMQGWAFKFFMIKCTAYARYLFMCQLICMPSRSHGSAIRNRIMGKNKAQCIKAYFDTWMRIVDAMYDGNY